MAEVKIIDIDGEQWNIKDQNAREKIATLETEIKKLETIEKWEYTVPTYGGYIVARRQGNVVSITAEGIGRVTPIKSSSGPISITTVPERFRPLETQFFILRLTSSYETQCGGAIYSTGEMFFWIYTEITWGGFSVSYIVD